MSSAPKPMAGKAARVVLSTAARVMRMSVPPVVVFWGHSGLAVESGVFPEWVG
ncbi:hypothetical protein D3C76_1732260 [compost metagenome]